MRVELGFVAPDNIAVSVAGVEFDAFGSTVARVPDRRALAVFRQRAKAEPDAARMIIGMFKSVDGDGEILFVWHHFPVRSREELAVAEAMEEIPNRVFDREIA